MPAYYDEIASPPMNDFKGGSFGPLREYHKKLIQSLGFYIARKNNEYLKKVHNKQNSILQNITKLLKNILPLTRDAVLIIQVKKS